MFRLTGWWFQRTWKTSQIGSFPQVGVKIKNCWNHHPAKIVLVVQQIIPCRSMQCNQGYMDPVAGSPSKRGQGESRCIRHNSEIMSGCQGQNLRTYALLLLATPYNPIIDIWFSTLNASRRVSQKNPTSAAAGFVAEKPKSQPTQMQKYFTNSGCLENSVFFPPRQKKNS